MGNRNIGVVVSDEHYEALVSMGKRNHSYPATVARFLLADAIDTALHIERAATTEDSNEEQAPEDTRQDPTGEGGDSNDGG